ncbi:MAG: phosphoribosyltransferase family protein [Candidatus Altiarchaeota archaeon]|nr:phosphoribosyltransferase family protein [Candidatus Altiarchaeota archaeon]
MAKALCAPLSLIIPRKIGAPYNPELAVAAVTQDGDLLLKEELTISLNIPPDYIEKEKKIQMEEIKRRAEKYGAKDIELEEKVVILVDDGIATGFTMLAAIKSLKKRNPQRIILAVPVAPSETIGEMKREVDEVIYLHTPKYFGAISQFYRTFPQTTDEEVIEILRNFG